VKILRFRLQQLCKNPSVLWSHLMGNKKGCCHVKKILHTIPQSSRFGNVEALVRT